MLLQKQFLFLKVNPTQQDLGMALLLGRRHVGSGQTAVWTFSTGNLALNTHSWCTYMVYWLPTSMPICSDGMVPTHKFAGSLPLVCRCQAMMGLDGQPAKYWKWSFFSCRKSFLCNSTEAWAPHATLHLITPVDIDVPGMEWEGGMCSGGKHKVQRYKKFARIPVWEYTLHCPWQWRGTQVNWEQSGSSIGAAQPWPHWPEHSQLCPDSHFWYPTSLETTLGTAPLSVDKVYKNQNQILSKSVWT